MHDVKAALRALALCAALAAAGTGGAYAQALTDTPPAGAGTESVVQPPAEAVPHDPALDPEGAVEHGEAGLPQLNTATYLPQVAWLALTFILLYLLMSRVALPRVAQVLQDRQDRIEDDLQKAEALRAEAQGVEHAYEKALSDARSQAAAVLSEAQAEISAQAARRQADFAAALAEKTADAEARIAAERQAALADVATIAADAARQLAAKVGRVEADADTAQSAVGTAMKERA